MLIKAMIVPLVLIICFGGGFVALTKPFNARATFVIFAFALAVLVFGYASGAPKWIAGLAILGAIGGLYVSRVKK